MLFDFNQKGAAKNSQKKKQEESDDEDDDDAEDNEVVVTKRGGAQLKPTFQMLAVESSEDEKENEVCI